MEFIINLIYAILFLGSGILILKYRKKIKSFTGGFAWAETYLGRGSSYLIIIIIGCGLVFIGATVPFGGIDFLFKR